MDSKAAVSIDLHIHSTASDGSFEPHEILFKASQLKLGAIAITDHDTVQGVKDALAYGIPESLQFLTGIEISAKPPDGFECFGSFHILGYGLRVEDTALNETLRHLQRARKNRNPLVIQRLRDLGFDISHEELENQVSDGQIGRPHIAQLMVKKGFAQSIDDAFDRFIGQGQPAYVDKFRLTSREAIQTITDAGGIPVLAHPRLIQLRHGRTIEELIAALKRLGLMGIEVYYPDHTPADMTFYRELAGQYDLIATGGTDFHGQLTPELTMGIGNGDLMVPYSVFESLTRHLQKGIFPAMESGTSLEANLGYRFSDPERLQEALRHSSYVNERSESDLGDNERLEFLGDAVLNLVIGHLLMQRYENRHEGDLSRMRAGLVNESQLAQIARQLDLGRHLLLGKGELQTNGQDKNSILADAFEAVTAAIYLDGGYDAAFKIVESCFSDFLTRNPIPSANPDYKSQLQELMQSRFRVMPQYRVMREIGPDHDKTFHIRMKVQDIETEGIGKSKKLAEQDAAYKAFKQLQDPELK